MYLRISEHKKTRCFLFSEGYKRDQWFEMGWCSFLVKHVISNLKDHYKLNNFIKLYWNAEKNYMLNSISQKPNTQRYQRKNFPIFLTNSLNSLRRFAYSWVCPFKT